MLAISIFSSPLPIGFPAPAAEVEDEELFVDVVFDDCPNRFIAANAASRLAPKGRCVKELLLTPALVFDELAVDIAGDLVFVVPGLIDDDEAAAFPPACLARSLARRGFELLTPASFESS
jgi:hypothetical protein